MRIAYLVNQYPHPSHSFIRREIAAVEACGIEVLRFSLRRSATGVFDPADVAEMDRTRVVLDARAALLWSVIVGFTTKPVAFARALRLALRLGWRSDRGLLRHLAYLAEACLLVRWLLESAADHVHAHFGTNPALVAMLSHELGGPRYSFTVHGPEEFDKPEFLGLAEKIQRAAFVAAVSHFGRGQLCRWSRHQDWPKLHVVRCGLDPDFLLAGPSPIPSEPRLVCVGRLSEQKGHLLLVEASARLRREGLDFRIVLVGDGPLRSDIEALIRQLDLREQVQLAGWMTGEQVKSAILASRAFLLPSYAEGLPVVLMEALALGRPVIATHVAGIPELVQDGLCGWLVPPGSVEALAEAMLAALQASPATLERMGRLGADRVAKAHDASKEASKLAALFRGLRAPASDLSK